LELIGATVTVTFSDGSSHRAALFHRENSDSGAEVLVGADAPTAPTIALVSVTPPTTLFEAAQTVQISAPAGSSVRLLQVEGALYEQSGGGHAVDPFEANSALTWREYSATVDSSGTATVPVTLTKINGSNSPGGLNYFVAVVEASADLTGFTSNVLVVDYVANGSTPTATAIQTPQPTATATATTPPPTATATRTPRPTATPTLTATARPTTAPSTTPTAITTPSGTAPPTERYLLPLIRQG
jgi:hypothetical protein